MLDGDLVLPMPAQPGPLDDAALAGAFKAGGPPALGDVERLFNAYLSEREPARAAALLRIAAAAGLDVAWLRALLARMLLASGACGAPRGGLVASLRARGTDGAWSALARAELALAPFPLAPAEGQWLVCRQVAASDGAEGGLALVLNGIAPSRRPVLEPDERRQDARLPQHLAAACTFAADDDSSLTVRGEVVDVSDTGLRVRIDNRFGSLEPDRQPGQRMQIEIPDPQGGAQLTLAGEVRWCRPERAGRKRVVMVGVQCEDAHQPGLAALAGLVAQGKGDQRFLWNLWEAFVTSR
ncbi:MAG: PilZ domain-containing protein [Chthonomonadales bacterium]|nr:PilZ domain-containing protein [Chthonomonadales bacterium]